MNICSKCVADCHHEIEPGEIVVQCGAYKAATGNGGHTMNNIEECPNDWCPELDEIITRDHLRELAQAEQDGRLVVLPCKVGDSLWVYDRDGKPREMQLDPPDIRCHCRDEDNLCAVLCSAKQTGICAYRLKNDASDIGKTVFLTRQEAVAALKGVEKDHG